MGQTLEVFFKLIFEQKEIKLLCLLALSSGFLNSDLKCADLRLYRILKEVNVCLAIGHE